MPMLDRRHLATSALAFGVAAPIAYGVLLALAELGGASDYDVVGSAPIPYFARVAVATGVGVLAVLGGALVRRGSDERAARWARVSGVAGAIFAALAAASFP